MQNIGQLMQVRDAMSQIALRNAQTQQAQQQAANIEQEAATRRRGLEQQQKAQAVWSDPLNHEKFAQDDYSPFWQAGISPEVAEPLISASQKISTASQGLKAGKAEYHAKGRELWGSVLSNALEGDLTDPRSAEMLNSWKENTGKDYPDLAQQVPTFTAGPTLPDQIKSAMQQNATFLPYLTAKAARDKATADLTKTAADTEKAKADALEAAARTPGLVATSQRETMATDLMRKAIAASSAGQNPIDTALPVAMDKRAHDSYVTAYQEALRTGDMKTASSIVLDAAKHAATISMADNPEIIQGEVKKAKAVEAAVGPMRTAQQVAAQRQMYGGNAAVAEVAPHLIPVAIAASEKVGQDYAQAAGDAKRIQDFVAAAQSGNKAAPGLIPITELRQLVNRVNPQELNAVSNSAGNAFDKVQGFFNKWTEGQPIPPEVLKDTATIANTLAQAAKRTANYKLQTVNHNYGSKFQLPEIGGEPAAGQVPEITDQASYNKLPKGAHYTNGGVDHVKQ